MKIILNYQLKTSEERLELVEKILEENPNPSPSYLEILADYLVIPIEREERKQHKILTQNRLATINKRETSYEGLAASLEAGEDGIYNLINDNPHSIFQPKKEITAEDEKNIPYLKEWRDAIADLETRSKNFSGRSAYIAKQTLIDMRKDQYIIKQAYTKPVQTPPTFTSKFPINLPCREWVDQNGNINYEGISLCNPKIISLILQYYSKLKSEAHGQFLSDLWYLLLDFEEIADAALKDEPLYYSLLIYKIDGLTNAQIQEALDKEYNIKYSYEYLSALWCKKIPKMIAQEAQERLLNYYYTEVEKGKYKTCSRCGQTKLAHPFYFSKNNTSKDGFYSQCKKCRAEKRKVKK